MDYYTRVPGGKGNVYNELKIELQKNVPSHSSCSWKLGHTQLQCGMYSGELLMESSEVEVTVHYIYIDVALKQKYSNT